MNLDELRKLPLRDVPFLVHIIDSDFTPTRQTVYNWAKRGIIRGQATPVILKTMKRIGGKIYTTPKWVKDFLNALK